MKLERNLPYGFLVLASCLWLAMVFVPPWAASRGYGAATLLYGIYAPVCHQIGERSFQCFGYSLGACHRCVGLYGGFLLGLLVMPWLPRFTAWISEYPRRMAWFALPMVADYFLWQNVWWSRGLSGLLAAFPVSLFVWAALTQLFSTRQQTVRAHHELS